MAKCFSWSKFIEQNSKNIINSWNTDEVIYMVLCIFIKIVVEISEYYMAHKP
jgi:hypothetical protein